MIGLSNFLLTCCFPLLLLHYVIMLYCFFFCLGFLSRAFTIHRTAKEGEGYFYKLSLPLPTTSQTLNISWVVTAGSQPLHIADTRARTGSLWFPSVGR